MLALKGRPGHDETISCTSSLATPAWCGHLRAAALRVLAAGSDPEALTRPQYAWRTRPWTTLLRAVVDHADQRTPSVTGRIPASSTIRSRSRSVMRDQPDGFLLVYGSCTRDAGPRRDRNARDRSEVCTYPVSYGLAAAARTASPYSVTLRRPRTRPPRGRPAPGSGATEPGDRVRAARGAPQLAEWSAPATTSCTVS